MDSHIKPLLYIEHTATRRNTPQHTATHCNTLQRTATHCNVHQHTGAVPPALKQSLREEASEGVVNSTLQHTATH